VRQCRRPDGELGINYFDTAPSYGDGLSERHLGQVLNTLQPAVYVGTKFRLAPEEFSSIRRAITNSLEASLQRLALQRVDLLQLHNHIGLQRNDHEAVLSVDDVLYEVVPALQQLQRQGKVRFFGITGLGETAAVHRVLDAGILDTVQVCYNLLNPSAGVAIPAGFPAQDFARLLDRVQQQNMGAIGIRVLAAGALSGTETRHPIAVPTVAPIASGPDYATDVQRAQRLDTLVQEGLVPDLVEASLRFALSNNALSTVLLGYSSLEQLEAAATAVAKGPLAAPVLERLAVLWQRLASRTQTA
jgi:aryl-alcohol dehydrogenase-like predicted oxidoreductase